VRWIAILWLLTVILFPLPAVTRVEQGQHRSGAPAPGVTVPFLGTVARDPETPAYASLAGQRERISRYGIRWVSVWGDFESNYLLAHDVEQLVTAGARVVVVRLGAAAPGCPTAEERSRGLQNTRVPVSARYAIARLELVREDGASLAQVLAALLSRYPDLSIVLQLGNEPDIEFDADCDGVYAQPAFGFPGGDRDDLLAYADLVARQASLLRRYAHRRFPHPERVYITAGTISARPGVDPELVDLLFSAPAFRTLDGYAINVYGDWEIGAEQHEAVRRLAAHGDGLLYVGEQGIAACFPEKGARHREAMDRYPDEITAVLLFTLGYWNHPEQDFAGCRGGDRYRNPFDEHGYAVKSYVLDDAVLAAVTTGGT